MYPHPQANLKRLIRQPEMLPQIKEVLEERVETFQALIRTGVHEAVAKQPTIPVQHLEAALEEIADRIDAYLDRNTSQRPIIGREPFFPRYAEKAQGAHGLLALLAGAGGGTVSLMAAVIGMTTAAGIVGTTAAISTGYFVGQQRRIDKLMQQDTYFRALELITASEEPAPTLLPIIGHEYTHHLHNSMPRIQTTPDAGDGLRHNMRRLLSAWPTQAWEEGHTRSIQRYIANQLAEEFGDDMYRYWSVRMDASEAALAYQDTLQTNTRRTRRSIANDRRIKHAPTPRMKERTRWRRLRRMPSHYVYGNTAFMVAEHGQDPETIREAQQALFRPPIPEVRTYSVLEPSGRSAS